MLEAIGEALPDPIRLMVPRAASNDLLRLLLGRGLLPLPVVPRSLLQPPTSEAVMWYGDPQALTGDLFLDGS
eukprot:9485367-Pyramimonas_sp.AAC.1